MVDVPPLGVQGNDETRRVLRLLPVFVAETSESPGWIGGGLSVIAGNITPAITQKQGHFSGGPERSIDDLF
jgi:hypothetical protein